MCNLSIPTETKGRKALFSWPQYQINRSMRISEIISEAFSLENTMSAVAADIGNNVTNTFDDLKKSASAWLGTHDDLRGWGFISGGIETRSWWDKVWSPLSNPKKGGKTVTGLQGEL